MRGIGSIYNELGQFLELKEISLNVTERQINYRTKNEYQQYAMHYQNNTNETELINNKEKIFDSNTPRNEKKVILVQLAAMNKIEAYRTIEKYISQPNIALYDWAYLALQESKLLIESSLLEEYKLLISTGLGGKGLKLRYFTFFLGTNDSDFSFAQKKTILREFKHHFSLVDAEIEQRNIYENIASFVVVIPLQINLDQMFHTIIDNCNKFENLLIGEYFITNLKILSAIEIEEMLIESNIIL